VILGNVVDQIAVGKFAAGEIEEVSALAEVLGLIVVFDHLHLLGFEIDNAIFGKAAVGEVFGNTLTVGCGRLLDRRWTGAFEVLTFGRVFLLQDVIYRRDISLCGYRPHGYVSCSMGTAIPCMTWALLS
jgi:hypothetical protein